MAYGLTKATNYYNNIEARKLWHRLADEAEGMGRPDLIVDCVPADFNPEGLGWRRLDKCSAKLREAIAKATEPTAEQWADLVDESEKLNAKLGLP